jgi:hypothetical protein
MGVTRLHQCFRRRSAAPKTRRQRAELGSAPALTGINTNVDCSVADPRTRHRVTAALTPAAHRLAARHGRAACNVERRARSWRNDAQECGVAQADLQAVGRVSRRRQRPLPQQRALRERGRVRLRGVPAGAGGCVAPAGASSARPAHGGEAEQALPAARASGHAGTHVAALLFSLRELPL